MKLLRGILFLFVLAAVALLAHGDREGKKEKRRGKKNKQADTVVGGIADPGNPPVNPVGPLEGAEPADDGQVDPVVIPSGEHNGKLNKGDKEARKAAKKAERKAAKKANKKADKKAAKKAAKKAEKKRLRQETRGEPQAGGNVTVPNDGAAVPEEVAARKEKTAARKAARKARKQLEQQAADAEIVSFDDIVTDRHGATNAETPIVEGGTDPANTSPDNGATGKGNADKAERRRLKKEQKKQRKQEGKRERKQHKKEQVQCDAENNCEQGSCCKEKKNGAKLCKVFRKQEGQKCEQDCMCRAGLSCVAEEGQDKRFCRVPGVPELQTGNEVGAVEDAVEHAITNGNQ